MAKKKTVTTVEEEELKDTPIDYKKDIEDKTFNQVATDTSKEDDAKKAEDEAKAKEEADAKAKEDETETVEFDPEQLKKEAVAQAKEELGDLLKGKTDQETKENVDEFLTYQEKFFKDNNRQPTWFEVAKFTKEQVRKDFDAEQEAKAKGVEAEKTKQTELQTQNTEATNKYVKDTLDELYTTDKLPKIQDKEDKDDYGIRVQNSLLKTVVDVNTKRIAEGQTPKTIKEIFYEDFKVPAKEVAGADAPVNMGRGGYTPDEDTGMDYREISGPRNSFRNIITNAFKKSS